jgi:hypothetical protein
MVDPPPTASTASAFSLRQISAPRFMVVCLGLGSTPDILGHMSRVFLKNIKFFFQSMEDEIKKETKKERKYGL